MPPPRRRQARTAPAPSRRTRLVHRHSHSPPTMISAKALAGIEASIVTAPLAPATPWAIPSSRSIDRPVKIPERSAEADGVEQQRGGLQRHDDEGRQRDGDEVGADAVQAGAVEMVKRERDQRHFHRQAGGDHRQQRPPEARRKALLPPLEEPPRPRARVKRDDRRNRGEAQLEARPGQRFRLDQQDRPAPPPTAAACSARRGRARSRQAPARRRCSFAPSAPARR